MAVLSISGKISTMEMLILLVFLFSVPISVKQTISTSSMDTPSLHQILKLQVKDTRDNAFTDGEACPLEKQIIPSTVKEFYELQRKIAPALLNLRFMHYYFLEDPAAINTKDHVNYFVHSPALIQVNAMGYDSINVDEFYEFQSDIAPSLSRLMFQNCSVKDVAINTKGHVNCSVHSPALLQVNAIGSGSINVDEFYEFQSDIAPALSRLIFHDCFVKVTEDDLNLNTTTHLFGVQGFVDKETVTLQGATSPQFRTATTSGGGPGSSDNTARDDSSCQNVEVGRADGGAGGSGDGDDDDDKDKKDEDEYNEEEEDEEEYNEEEERQHWESVQSELDILEAQRKDGVLTQEEYDYESNKLLRRTPQDIDATITKRKRRLKQIKNQFSRGEISEEDFDAEKQDIEQWLYENEPYEGRDAQGNFKLYESESKYELARRSNIDYFKGY